ncbi:hypothetical protein [Deinococcus sp.]|uniref:hypothetical protein n=1 Tax=Deinococcus sp. TaxID=47478 RepID=UPI0025C4BEE5|nr:hypothetical protein [Deinococcus sp.]
MQTKYPVRKAAVNGAGVLGAAIAAQLANADIPVLLEIVLPDKPDRNFPTGHAILNS